MAITSQVIELNTGEIAKSLGRDEKLMNEKLLWPIYLSQRIMIKVFNIKYCQKLLANLEPNFQQPVIQSKKKKSINLVKLESVSTNSCRMGQ